MMKGAGADYESVSTAALKPDMTVSQVIFWAYSAAGSAPEWHSGGHRFDPD